MVDGSRMGLEENIRVTREIADLARAAGIPCEGELGAVLDRVLAYETGVWKAGETPSAEHMQKAFWDAAEYAHRMMAQMSSAVVG